MLGLISLNFRYIGCPTDTPESCLDSLFCQLKEHHFSHLLLTTKIGPTNHTLEVSICPLIERSPEKQLWFRHMHWKLLEQSGMNSTSTAFESHDETGTWIFALLMYITQTIHSLQWTGLISPNFRQARYRQLCISGSTLAPVITCRDN